MIIEKMKSTTSATCRMAKKRTVISLAVCSLAAVLLTSCGGKSETTIVVAGSTSVQPYAEILVEEYARLFNEQEIDVQGGGSSAGIAAAESGTADIGMSSRGLKEKEQGLWSTEIAKDGLAIIINPKNPITDLSIKQIRQIYAGEVINWSGFGGAEEKIHIISREEGSGTRSAFEELVMEQTIITPKAIVQDSNGAVKQLVADDACAIGFISLGLVDDTVKSVRLEGADASSENVMNGSYSLFRPFLFVTSVPPEGLTKQFIDFVLSEEGQRVLIKEGLIPVAGGKEE